jgi:hypothetical protein
MDLANMREQGVHYLIAFDTAQEPGEVGRYGLMCGRTENEASSFPQEKTFFLFRR